MLGYLIRRLGYAILVLFAVSLLTFFMSTLAPGDQVASHLTLEGNQLAYRNKSYGERLREYKLVAQRLGLDLPVFYFSVQPHSFPDTLYRIINKDERIAARALLYRHGNWNAIQQFRSAIHDNLKELQARNSESVYQHAGRITSDLEFLLTTYDTGRIAYLLTSIGSSIPDSLIAAGSAFKHVTNQYTRLQSHRIGISQLLPEVVWHGRRNQYSVWISKTLSGNLGVSLIDGRPVSSKIREALRWTLSINIAAILLAFGIGIPLGVIAARRAGARTDRIISSVLFALFAIPSFWLAMLCIVFLTTSEYGSWLDWFPTSGVGITTPSMSFGEILLTRISHLALPVICAMAGSLAYLTRQMRGSMLRELRQDYIRMARAKGLSEDVVHWKHAFRNALFPMITLIGSSIPAVISGSVILEVIFSIPGMGRLLYMSILSRDWPVVYAMVLLAASLTIIGYLISDLLYHRADPRVDLNIRKA